MTAIPLALAGAVAACGGDDAESVDATQSGPAEDQSGTLDARDNPPVVVAELQDPDGSTVGQVRFQSDDGGTRVTVAIEGLDAEPGFHGFHVHANDDPGNGEDCSARAGEPAESWFTSADAHLSREGERHGDHQGDMPSLLVDADRTATAELVTDRFSTDDIEGTAVIVHAEPDNFGNVPTGGGDEQYTPNADAAVTETQDTGNAGDRIACGVVDSGDG